MNRREFLKTSAASGGSLLLAQTAPVGAAPAGQRVIEPALAAKSSRVPGDAIRALLAECDAARYAPPSELPSADACRAAGKVRGPRGVGRCHHGPGVDKDLRQPEGLGLPLDPLRSWHVEDAQPTLIRVQTALR